MKSNKLIITLILICAAMVCIPLGAWAQTIVTGGFSGTITDPTGATVPDAALSLTSKATGDTATSVTGAHGEYAFSLLKPGEYTLSVKKDGFKTYSRTITVLLGQNLTANVASSGYGGRWTATFLRRRATFICKAVPAIGTASLSRCRCTSPMFPTTRSMSVGAISWASCRACFSSTSWSTPSWPT